MKPFENYIQYLKRLQSNYEAGTGQHNVLGIAINEAEEALRQFAVSGTFCEKCNPNVVVDGNVIRCKKCGRGLALVEQNYH